MGLRKTLLLATLVAMAVPAFGGTAFAREQDDERPLRQPSIPATADRVTDFYGYWDNANLSGQAQFLFGLPNYRAQRIERAARRLNNFYDDIRDQQPGQSIVRTRDMISPFCDSLLDVVPCGVSVQPPMAPPPAIAPMPVAPPAPPAVPALY
jgi:hypothetical protein